MGRYILCLCPLKQLKHKFSLRLFWLPVCQCTGNICPSFKEILLCDLSYMGCFCAFISLCMFALEGFLRPWICHFSFPSPVIMLKGTSVSLQGPPARSGPHSPGTPRGLFTCYGQIWCQEPGGKTWGREEGIWAQDTCSQQKDHRIKELFVFEEPIKIT